MARRPEVRVVSVIHPEGTTSRVLVRADASTSIGTGHVMRCLTLARALSERGAAVTFVSCELDGSLRERVLAAGHDLVEVHGAPGGAGDVSACSERAREATAIVVDGYGFDAAYRRALRAAGLPVLALDDLVAGPLEADLVLNPSPDASEAAYRAAGERAELLLGPRFALVRVEVLAHRESTSVGDGVLVTFGGSDPLGLTVPVAEALRRALPSVVLWVVLGGSVREPSAIERALRVIDGPTFVVRNLPDLGDAIARSRIAVSAAGSTMYELAALGRPSVLVVVAENQRSAALRAHADGWAIAVDGRSPGAAARVAEAASRLHDDEGTRRALAVRARAEVDGRGADRAAEALLARVRRVAGGARATGAP